MMKGKVRDMKGDHGYGFITGDDKKDYFFHRSACEEDWSLMYDLLRQSVDVMVEFTESKGPKGLRAEGVVMVRQ